MCFHLEASDGLVRFSLEKRLRDQGHTEAADRFKDVVMHSVEWVNWVEEDDIEEIKASFIENLDLYENENFTRVQSGELELVVERLTTDGDDGDQYLFMLRQVQKPDVSVERSVAVASLIKALEEKTGLTVRELELAA